MPTGMLKGELVITFDLKYCMTCKSKVDKYLDHSVYHAIHGYTSKCWENGYWLLLLSEIFRTQNKLDKSDNC